MNNLPEIELSEPRLEPNSAKPIAPKGRMIGESANDDLSN